MKDTDKQGIERIEMKKKVRNDRDHRYTSRVRECERRVEERHR